MGNPCQLLHPTISFSLVTVQFQNFVIHMKHQCFPGLGKRGQVPFVCVCGGGFMSEGGKGEYLLLIKHRNY